ncbi:hypothetical protein OH491_02820 [Termitidicoccus mucosus]|uniref:Uncharacterized protein n=1 Tax=Termitidicoccus mucosus TaxID=1184151 RepID=A0A178ILD3_9BACT|nr:hypothetical protein AW736_06730 [Opitutaceae bacterium TSB47]
MKTTRHSKNDARQPEVSATRGVEHRAPAWKAPVIFLALAALCLLPAGCLKNEKHEKYMSARREMEQAEKPSPSNEDTVITFERKQKHYAYAEKLFGELGDYKDSIDLYKEAAYRSGIAYAGRNDFAKSDLERAYRQFLKAGNYKDAAGRALEVSLAITDKLLRGNSHNLLAGFFGKLDAAHKGGNAAMIQQYALEKIEKLLGKESDALDLLSDSERNYLREILERKSLPDEINKAFYDSILSGNIKSMLKARMNLLEIIKNDAPPMPENIREKLYGEVSRQLADRHFWRANNSTHLQENAMRILGLIGDYKDAGDLRRRIENAWKTPVIKAEDWPAQSAKAGAHPRPRTICVVVSHDGKDGFVSSRFQELCEEIKHRSAGSVFMTDDAGNASAILHCKIGHSFWSAFQYSGGTTGDYYHTSLAVELRSTDGGVLYTTTREKKWDAPLKEIGGYFAGMPGSSAQGHVNVCAHVDMDASLYAGLLKALEAARCTGAQTTPE